MIVSFNQMKNIARLALIKDDVEAITKRWKALGGYSAPPRANDSYQKELKDLFKKNNCDPLMSMIGIFVQVICINCAAMNFKAEFPFARVRRHFSSAFSLL